MEKYSVVIVGAGVAGCKAAKTLLDNGISDIKVLEATDRIGGRAYTVCAEYGNIEYGAQWIHGSEGNILYEDLNELALLDYKGEHLDDDEYVDHMRYFKPHGRLIDQPTIANIVEIYDAISDEISSHWDPNRLPISQFKTDIFKRLCDEAKVSAEERDLYEAVIVCKEKHQGISEGIVPNDRSFLIGDVYDTCGGKNYLFREGTISIINRLLLPSIENKITLCKPVKKLEWSNPDGVIITTNSGTIQANHVIVTPSLGYLKSNLNTFFVPPLPKAKCDAIDRLTFGKAEKFIYVFDEPFWDEELKKDPEFSGYSFVYTEDEVKPLDALLYEKHGNQVSWWRELAFISTCSTNPNALIVWLAGDACDTANHCSDEVLLDVTFSVIRYFTGTEVTGSCKFYRTSWSTNEYYLGSWSTLTKDFKSENGEEMSQPVYHGDKPVILFAGEAYHHRCMSALHGAYEHGLTQAKKIVNYYNQKQFLHLS